MTELDKHVLHLALHTQHTPLMIDLTDYRTRTKITKTKLTRHHKENRNSQSTENIQHVTSSKTKNGSSTLNIRSSYINPNPISFLLYLTTPTAACLVSISASICPDVIFSKVTSFSTFILSLMKWYRARICLVLAW